MNSKMTLFAALCAMGVLSIIFHYNASMKHFGTVQNFQRGPACETIHIGIVCLKDSFKIVDFYIMLKAFCFFRQSPLRFHLLVDNITETIVRALFSTWTIPEVSVNIYNVRMLPKSFRWILNDANSTKLQKFAFPLIVSNVSSILVMDSGLICIGDIDELWQLQYQHFSQTRILNWLSDVLLLNLRDLNVFETYKQLRFAHKSSHLVPAQKDFKHTVCKIHNTPLNRNITTFLKFDTDLLSNLSSCFGHHSKPKVPNNKVSQCVNVPEVNTHYFKYRTLLFIRDFEHKSVGADITMVTQMSLEKLPVFEIICQRWTGPVSVSLYLKEEELPYVLNFIAQSKQLNKRRNIAYHVLFKNGHYQPINKLRNVALEHANTPYVLLNDVDFVPGPNLYSEIQSEFKKIKGLTKKALVIPAFAAVNSNVTLPVNLSQAREMWTRNDIVQFHKNYFPKGHGPTDYDKLKTATKPYKIKWKPNYEPYVVVERSVPKYDERFVGYIWNKIQHIHELDAAGYEFIVLPNTFLIHKYHERSADFQSYLKSKYYYPCVMALKKVFLNELNRKYQRQYVFKDFSV